MQKRFKNFVVIFCAVIFAFCPIFIAGCDLSDVGGSTSQGGSSKPSYNVNDYLSALKVAYTPAVNGTTDESINEYVNQVLGVTELMAVDTLVELMETYNKNNDKKFTYSKDDISKTFSTTNNIAFVGNDENNITITYTNTETGESSPYTIIYENLTFKGTMFNTDLLWKIFEAETENNVSVLKGSGVNKLLNYFISGESNGSSQELTVGSVAYKMVYAILSISNTFNNVTDDNFDTAYASFTTDYDNAIKSNDLESKCRQLATITKHSGLVAGTSEAKAFKQYILDYIIGTENVKNDNDLVSTYSNGSYEPVGDVYEGEYYRFDDTLDSLVEKIKKINENSNNKISYIELLEEIAEKESLKIDDDITLIIENGKKLWQDFDGDNRLTKKDDNDTDDDDIVYATDKNGNKLKDEYGKDIPKYRVDNPEFRNYDWTVGKIVEKVLGESEITYKNESGQENKITGYPTTSNVFSIDYAYKNVEISGSDMNAKYTCSLPRNAYKSILICAKDRTGKDIANNIGYINMILESAEGVSVDVKIFARYYRTGSGYATWDNGYGDDKTLYPLVKSGNEVKTLTINGPYKVEIVNGVVQDSSLEINVQDMFKNAKFNGESNANKFTFTYEDSEKVEQTKQIYGIEPFPDGFYNTSLNKAVHAQVFGVNGKTNPTYKTINLPTGEVLYSYETSNLTDVADGYGYIEILFAPSNDNAFTFGLLGYVPENENTI